MKQIVMGILAFATLAFAAPATGEGIGGWEGGEVGMTPNQVQEVLSHPTSVADLAKACRGPCNEGAALELDDYDLNGQHFLVRLWFDWPDKRLQAVCMYAKQLDKSNGNDGMKNYLESVYGRPKSIALNPDNFVVTWTQQSTAITLYSNAADQMTVVYEQRTDKEGETHSRSDNPVDKASPQP